MSRKVHIRSACAATCPSTSARPAYFQSDRATRTISTSRRNWSPGTTGPGGGRPGVSPLIVPCAFLVPRDAVQPVVRLGDQVIPVPLGRPPGPSAVAALPDDERAAWEAESTELELPSFAQVWALGFMYVVENWTEAWEAPRDRDTAQWLDDSLQKLVALTEDDTATPDVSMYAEDGPPSVSQVRLNAFGEALWAVYDLHQIWSSLGPRVGTVVKGNTPGRNDPCSCGSGKKFKKCCGA